MSRRTIFTKFVIAIALVVLVVTGLVWELRRAKAMPTAVENQPSFGMVGITRGQTMRLNVVNLVLPSENQAPPDPCRMVLTFRDPNGRPFTNSNGQVVRREVSLQAGESAFLDLNADIFGAPPSTNGDATTARLQLRPFVRVLGDPPSGNQAPTDPCRATMEVFDNATGRTSILAGGFEPPPDPDRGQ